MGTDLHDKIPTQHGGKQMLYFHGPASLQRCTIAKEQVGCSHEVHHGHLKYATIHVLV